jgi:hypothetical protein
VINGATGYSFIANQSGNYYVKIDSANCATNSLYKPVTVVPLPTVSVSLNSNLINIQNPPLTITSSPQGGIISGKGVLRKQF